MGKTLSIAANHHTNAFFSLINHPIQFKLYLLKNLPAGFFSGLTVREACPASCTVSIPYKWFTRNPFRSTYFACLSMAAELSTGVLAMAHVYQRKPSISMLVTGIEGKFHKKATGLSFFHCADGQKFNETISTAISLSVPQEIRAYSIGKNKDGNVVAEFWITWSFKVK